jgi:nitrous oxidase accessory protein NosD
MGFSAHAQRVIDVTTARELQALLAEPLVDVDIRLAPGDYHLSPTPAIDSTCGNCEDPDTDVLITVGVQISGSGLRLIGPSDQTAVLYTHAGYGLYFKDCENCYVEDLVITGGQRDPDANATDAAVVVKNSSVTLQHNRIENNLGDSTIVAGTVVGVIGICGRENARITAISNKILRNSWDGIALYRDAEAKILQNTIDGVDKARGKQIGGGRGVAVGVTWNARAEIRDNLVKRYWKGIGLFVDAQGTVVGNIVEDVLTWGIALWDADKGRPVGRIERNVIYNTGACGASITCGQTPDDAGRFSENIVVLTAQNPKYDDPDYYCYQCALALHAVPEGFAIEGNMFYNNRRATEDLPDHDMSENEFRRAIEPLCKHLSNSTVLAGSDFLREFGPSVRRRHD